MSHSIALRSDLLALITGMCLHFCRKRNFSISLRRKAGIHSSVVSVVATS